MYKISTIQTIKTPTKQLLKKLKIEMSEYNIMRIYYILKDVYNFDNK